MPECAALPGCERECPLGAVLRGVQIEGSHDDNGSVNPSLVVLFRVLDAVERTHPQYPDASADELKELVLNGAVAGPSPLPPTFEDPLFTPDDMLDRTVRCVVAKCVQFAFPKSGTSPEEMWR